MNTLDLSGTWQLRWYDGQRGQNRTAAERDLTDPAQYMPAEVPGEIHLDLMREGILADTNDGANVLAARWVEEFLWTYRREFEAPEGLGEAPAWLVFERLFLAARIVLNGQEIAAHCNAFRPLRVDVTGKLRPGKNVLVVHIESGLYWAADKPASAYAYHIDSLLQRRSWLRAPQCQFGWDWSPRLMNVGISGSVVLEWTAAPVRVDAFVPLAELSDDLTTGRLTARVFLEALTATEVEVEASIPELGASSTVTHKLEPGEARIDVSLEGLTPELWWPIGHGEPKRYEVTAKVCAGGAVSHLSAKVGFRHVLWDQSPHPKQGRYFRLIVNGRPIFCRGANFVPADAIFARIDGARYETLTERALEANFNFLRVWGGGLYEDEAFYELCDAKGILVWQEFIYACAKYPMTDESFHEEAKREATYQVRRLARRPSLVAWCGNNEMEEGNWHWGFDKGTVHPDYAFFHLTLRRLMAAEDPTRYYQPSSPISPDFQDPHLDHMGDQHPWTVSFFDTDTRKYRDMECRFPNEGGVMGPTSVPTLRRCLDGGQIGGHAWKVHDNSIATWREPSVIDDATMRFFRKDMREMSIEEYVYWAGLVQAEGLKEYIDSFRRRMFDTACAIFWMFNDTWPAARSWTIVDYDLRRTASFSSVRDALSPVRLVLAVEGERVVVFGVNDTLEPVQGALEFGVVGLDGSTGATHRTVATLGPNASSPVGEFALSEWTDPTAQIAIATLSSSQGTLRNRLILPMWHEMQWAEPAVQVSRVPGGHELLSSAFVPGVCVGLGAERAEYPAFFDLYPGVPVFVAEGAPIVVGHMSGTGVGLAVIRE